MYASRYGFWRIYVMTVIYNNLDCGDLHMEFARVRCESGFNVYLCDRIHPSKIGLGNLARYIIRACF